MRITWGHQLFLAGANKLGDIEGTVQLFTQFHIPSPTFHAYEVGLVEALGGILLVLGLASRIASIPIFIIMLTALSTAHAEYLGNLRFVTDPHILAIQQPYPYLLTALMVFVFGPGRISIDGWIKRWAARQPKC